MFSQICRTYGFKNKENPIIFKSNGTIIGGAHDFEIYCENNFGVSGVQNSKLKSDTIVTILLLFLYNLKFC